ncbi:MAG TPA: O-antigen ligase family protein, partial [Candidatus Edwardsbacteria bacterium]|nr:O-antigen ligase family protein [Candidatus Edwardsbacteria bacterium]
EYLGFFMGALMLLYAAMLPSVPIGLRPLVVAGIVAMGLANIVTFHRGAWFVTVMGFLVLLLRRRGKKAAYLAVTIAVVVTVLQLAPNLVTSLMGERFRLSFSANDVSFQDRKTLFLDVTLPAIAAHPLGEGIGTIGGAAMSLHRITGASTVVGLTESGYLSTARQLGIPGLLIELVLHVLLLAASLRAINKAATPWERSLVAGIAAVQVMFILGGFSDYPGELLPTNILFWLLSGLAVQIDLRSGPS